jgi:hypothetical protein
MASKPTASTKIRARSFDEWAKFKSMCELYSRQSLERRDQWIFRGQANREWPLETTLDRFVRKAKLKSRDEALVTLLREFMRGANGLEFGRGYPAGERGWELLARHHALPSPYLDWTQSPYAAAFFAFADPLAASAEEVAVWALDREVFVESTIPEIEVIDDVEAVRFNARAIEQRALFLRVNSTSKSVEELLGSHLFRFNLSASMRAAALADLDSMMINDRTMFRDLEGAARMAAARIGIRTTDG